jgi:hypothetical protein
MVFSNSIVKFGRRLALAIYDQPRDIGPRVVTGNIEAKAFFEHHLVPDFGDPQ